MPQIPMVQLTQQHTKLQSAFDESMKEVMDSGVFIGGPAVHSFKTSLEQYLNVKHVIPCGNGTDALQIALMALDLPEKSEVIVPGFTYAALAEVVGLLGHVPVFVDVEEGSFNLDVSKIEAAITPQTKVIAPVHLFGQNADMEPILSLAKQYNLFVLEDSAQSIGSKYQFTNGTEAASGCTGDLGTTSFFPSKNLGCMGDGGAIFTNDDDLAAKVKMIANHGQEVKYFHKVLGVNSRLDALQAAILSVKLEYLDSFSSHRHQAGLFYNELLKDCPMVSTPTLSKNSDHVFHQYTLKVERRDELKDFLKSKGISSMIYYPMPLHKQEAYKQAVHLPISEKLVNCVLSLPICSEINKETQTYICESILEFYNT